MENENSNSYLHYRYVIFLLTLVIISLIVFRYTADTALYNYVSFAATLASLILAVLAIIQGMFSGNSFDSSLKKLNKSSSVITKNSTELNQIIEKLNERVNELPKMINDLGIKIDEQNTKLTRSSKDDAPESTITNDKESFLNNFLTSSSKIGQLLIYAICLSLKESKSFEISDILPDEEAFNYQYAYAYIVCSHAAQIVNIQENNSKQFNVISSQISLNQVTVVINNMIATSTSENYFQSLINFRNKIDRFFQSSN